MHPYWKQESELVQLVENHRALSASEYLMALDDDMAHLDHTIHTLQVVQKRVSRNQEHSQRVGELIDFVQSFRKEFPKQKSEQAFERIQVLRQWLFWLPTSMLRGGDSDLNALPILAQFYAVGIALDRFYPEMGGTYLGAISISPIEEAYNILAAHSAGDPFNADLRLAMALMDLPRHIVARYRSLLAWSPRPSIEHYSPGPPSPYHVLSEYPLVSSSSPESASPSHAAYTPPLQSPPAVTVAGSPFQLADGYIGSAPSHALYPPSPQLLDTHDAHLGLSELSHAEALPVSSAFTPPYGDALCPDMSRANGMLGLNMEVYPQTHPFEIPTMSTPETCWT